MLSAARLAHAAVLPGEPDVISVLVPSTARGRESHPPALLLLGAPCSFETPPLGFEVLQLDASFVFLAQNIWRLCFNSLLFLVYIVRKSKRRHSVLSNTKTFFLD